MPVVLYPEDLQQLIEVEFNFLHRALSKLSAEEQVSIGIQLQDHDPFPYHLCTSFPVPFCNLIRGQPSSELMNQLPSLLKEINSYQDVVYLAVMPDDSIVPFIQQLQDLDFQISGFEDIWIMDLDQIEPEKHSSIVQVSEDQLAAYINVTNTAFDVNGESEQAMTMITRGMFRDEKNALFGFMSEDQMVGAGLCHVNGDTAYLGGGSALEAFRGRTIQQHLLTHRMSYAKEQGAKYAVVTTSVNTTSGRNMSRLGFQKAMTFTNYVYSDRS